MNKRRHTKIVREGQYLAEVDVEINQLVLADGRWVLRGGAFLNYPRNVHCAARRSNVPDFRNLNVGLRAVVSPFFSER